jgi:hypothetical protein
MKHVLDRVFTLANDQISKYICQVIFHTPKMPVWNVMQTFDLQLHRRAIHQLSSAASFLDQVIIKIHLISWKIVEIQKQSLTGMVINLIHQNKIN